jgi:adenosylcobinamide-GDP ribazoletransferase
VKDFLQALSFLTILPVGGGSFPEGKAFARSMALFPFAGLLIGFLGVLGWTLLSLLFAGPFALWLTIAFLAFLTGGLHLDGFADTLDGLACRGTRERILDVMRDSRIGAFGAAGLIFLVGAKYLALDQVSIPSLPRFLLMMVVTGRAAMVLVCFRSPYARSGPGLAKSFVENLRFRETAFSSLSALGIAFALLGVAGIIAFFGTGLFSLGYRFFFLRKLGGVTGDILGAANELAELLCLILLILLKPIQS